MSLGTFVEAAKTLLDRFEGLSKTAQVFTAFPVFALIGLLFASVIDNRNGARAASDAREARHAAYVRKCQPLKEKYFKTQETFGLNATKREQDNAYIDFKVCEAGERVDAIIAGDVKP